MMTHEEVLLDSRMKRQMPFRVPDGYFEQLTSQVMAQLPERKPSLTVRLRPWLYAAAGVCLAVLCGTGVYFHRADNVTADTEVTTTATDSYFDEVADHMMVDNQDIYACLTSEY